MRLFLYILMICAVTVVNAQTVEERLPLCIKDAQVLIEKGRATRKAFEAIDYPSTPSSVAELLFNDERIRLIGNIFQKAVDEDKRASEIEQLFEIAVPPFERKVGLVADMFAEAWNGDSEYTHQAGYIAECVNNFDGLTETQASRIFELELELDKLQGENEQLDATITRLNDRSARQQQTISALNQEKTRLRTDAISAERQFNNAEDRILEKDQRLKRLETELAHKDELITTYRVRLLNASGPDIASYLKKLLKLGAMQRNEEIRNGILGQVKVSSSDELKCISDLRDKAKLTETCEVVLTNLLLK